MKKIIVVILGCMCMSACSTAPIYNVEKQSVPATNKQDVQKAIFVGSSRKGWTITEMRDDVMVATLQHKYLFAEVEIPYSDDSYSIYYKNSKNLHYGSKRNTIHTRYNRWIRNLQDSINTSFR